jgi:hypothetical protein
MATVVDLNVMPGASPAEPGGGAVAQPSDERVSDHGHQSAGPATRESFPDARSSPTRPTTFRASVTSSGAISSSIAYTDTAAYQAMKPFPTRDAVTGWDMPPSTGATTASWGT